MAAWNGWEDDVLNAGGWPDSSENRIFLQEWHSFEASKCLFNPLNTTQKRTGSRGCVQTGTGGVAVQTYTGTVQGTAATVSTLKSFRYPNIQEALREGNPFAYVSPQAVADELNTWGSVTFVPVYLEMATGSSTGAQPGQTAPPTQQSSTASGLRGYADLRNSVARHLPTHLMHSRRAGAATLRTLAHRSKVGH